MGKRSICLLLLGCLSTSLWASTYRPATIVSVHQEPRTETNNILHNTVLDSTIITKTGLVYVFEVRAATRSISLSTSIPESYRTHRGIGRHRWRSELKAAVCFIKDHNGNELETRIVKHAKP